MLLKWAEDQKAAARRCKGTVVSCVRDLPSLTQVEISDAVRERDKVKFTFKPR